MSDAYCNIFVGIMEKFAELRYYLDCKGVNVEIEIVVDIIWMNTL